VRNSQKPRAGQGRPSDQSGVIERGGRTLTEGAATLIMRSAEAVRRTLRVCRARASMLLAAGAKRIIGLGCCSCGGGDLVGTRRGCELMEADFRLSFCTCVLAGPSVVTFSPFASSGARSSSSIRPSVHHVETRKVHAIGPSSAEQSLPNNFKESENNKMIHPKSAREDRCSFSPPREKRLGPDTNDGRLTSLTVTHLRTHTNVQFSLASSAEHQFLVPSHILTRSPSLVHHSAPPTPQSAGHLHTQT
jgi:hypothetical protein